MTTPNTNMWEYGHGQQDWADRRLIGYKVQAMDGDIGKIDDATTETGAHSCVVDTGPWIFGQKVLLPAGLIERVDHDTQQVYLVATKDQVKNAPEFDQAEVQNAAYRQRVGDYYGNLPRR